MRHNEITDLGRKTIIRELGSYPDTCDEFLYDLATFCTAQWTNRISDPFMRAIVAVITNWWCRHENLMERANAT
jgi:hypothetical protein